MSQQALPNQDPGRRGRPGYYGVPPASAPAIPPLAGPLPAVLPPAAPTPAGTASGASPGRWRRSRSVMIPPPSPCEVVRFRS